MNLHSPTVRSIVALSAATLLTASGCTLPNSRQIDYRNTERSSVSTLEMPPDIVHPSNNLKRAEAGHHVLPSVSGMHIERANHAHWLVVERKTPAQLWPQLREFWQTQGFTLSVDARERGILETGWKTSRPHLNQGVIRNTLSKVKRLGNAYVTSGKNQYRTRVVANPDGRTWISIHHQGQREVLAGIAKETTRWQLAPNDPSLEVEYLQRLMYALADKDSARTPLQPERSATATPSAQLPSEPAHERLEVPANAPAQLDLHASFDHVWPQIGLALERAHFTVAERNREQGAYTLRYVEISEPQPQQRHARFWQRIFQKKNKDKQAQPYILKVQTLDAATTRIFIANEQGEVDTSTRARRILRLLTQRLH